MISSNYSESSIPRLQKYIQKYAEKGIEEYVRFVNII